MNHAARMATCLAASALALGCSQIVCGPLGSGHSSVSDGSADTSWSPVSDAYSGPVDVTSDPVEDAAGLPDEVRTVDGREVEELDLFKLVGDWLYVHGTYSGLNVIDVSAPEEPKLHVQLPELSGPAGELFVRDGRAVMLLESTRASCPFPVEMNELGGSVGLTSVTEATEIAALISVPDDPKIAGTYCLPGKLVSSRVVGDILYAVTTHVVPEWYGVELTWLLSIDLSDATHMRLADQRVMEGESREIHVTPEAIFIAQAEGPRTRIQYMDISDPAGLMVERDSILVDGEPQGRWHMDAYGDTFRIVTYSSSRASTNLHVIDTSSPDMLLLVGAIMDLASGEELWATRFVGEKVYVVTYLRWVEVPHDPLWVISLADPRYPIIEGFLEIPGWSNFIYPRGDRLVAAGRGDGGEHVALSLYDVSDPTRPRELERLDIGAATSTSEVNEDHRGVSIIENEVFGEPPLILIPYTTNLWTGDGCVPLHHVQLVDLLESDLRMRGLLHDDQLGRVARTFPVGARIYSISDRLVGSIDAGDRDRPVLSGSVFIGDPDEVDECLEEFPTDDDDWDDDWDDWWDPGDSDPGGYDPGGYDPGGYDPGGYDPGDYDDPDCWSGCSIDPSAGPGGAWILANLVLALAFLLRARRR